MLMPGRRENGLGDRPHARLSRIERQKPGVIAVPRGRGSNVRCFRRMSALLHSRRSQTPLPTAGETTKHDEDAKESQYQGTHSPGNRCCRTWISLSVVDGEKHKRSQRETHGKGPSSGVAETLPSAPGPAATGECAEEEQSDQRACSCLRGHEPPASYSHDEQHTRRNEQDIPRDPTHVTPPARARRVACAVSRAPTRYLDTSCLGGFRWLGVANTAVTLPFGQLPQGDGLPLQSTTESLSAAAWRLELSSLLANLASPAAVGALVFP